MYLFAQRVRSMDGRRGINAGLYVHATSIDDDLWARAPHDVIRLVTSERPGTRIRERVAIAPGGNRIESFLDIVGPDTASGVQIARAIAAARRALASASVPEVVLRDDLLTVAFGWPAGEVDPSQDLDLLGGAALSLHAETAEPAWKQQQPLEVRIDHDADAWHFRLSEASAQRVTEAQGSPSGVSIRHDVADDFRLTHGTMYPFVAEWVSGLARERILELGGARFIDDDLIVAEWPARG